MKRFFLLLMSIAALGLVLGAGACKKGEEKAAEGEAKPAEGGEAAGEEKAGEEKPAEEKAGEEKAAEGEGEAKEGEAAAGDSPKTGIEECDKLIETYVKCDKLPQSARDAFLQNADAWKKALEAGGDAAKTQLVESCKQAAEAAKQSLSALGC